MSRKEKTNYLPLAQVTIERKVREEEPSWRSQDVCYSKDQGLPLIYHLLQTKVVVLTVAMFVSFRSQLQSCSLVPSLFTFFFWPFFALPCFINHAKIIYVLIHKFLTSSF